MGAINQKELNRQQNIRIAAGFMDDSDRTIIVNSNLWQLLGYRRRVAEQIVRGGEIKPETRKHLEDLFDKCQDDIKQMLGLMDEPEKSE